ncbi:hypothetical protein [Gloeothece verrucosa]|uniref:Uncharacterized protein n=1 Tax=Gloeothece verrucosa (strain PCC 7822) TaxID=497965 RepID=E0UD57_GLOV7|nr:hypothetical protein [Gloeothece verrucosa]ADN12937.1 hypothetical protein Cyan7822_0923 [Gloeothece verrucosa PCC 7822]
MNFSLLLRFFLSVWGQVCSYRVNYCIAWYVFSLLHICLRQIKGDLVGGRVSTTPGVVFLRIRNALAQARDPFGIAEQLRTDYNDINNISPERWPDKRLIAINE